MEKNQHFICLLSKSYRLPSARWEDPLHPLASGQALGSPVLPWIFVCQPLTAGYSAVVTRMPFLPGEKAVPCYLCREKRPVHFAQLSMHVWKYNTQMSRNKNILNLKKLSNTVGKTSELEVNPKMSKKRISEM